MWAVCGSNLTARMDQLSFCLSQCLCTVWPIRKL